MDVVTLGETMIRFSPPQAETLERSALLHADPGGAESNVAIALARLGLATAWISRLPENAMGRRIAGQIRQHGVDTSRVVWAPSTERVGTYYIEPGRAPRPTSVIYDRAGSALSRIEPADVDWGYVQRAGWLHLTGITPGLGAGPRRTLEEAVRVATGRGMVVSFDVNYRAKVWPADEAAAVLAPLLEDVALILCAARDAALLFGTPAAGPDAARALSQAFRPRLVVVTAGEAGAFAYDGADYHAPSVVCDTLDPVGSGDAFAAGFIAGYRDGDVEQGLAWGNAAAALKRTYRGDILWATRQELQAILEETGSAILR